MMHLYIRLYMYLYVYVHINLLRLEIESTYQPHLAFYFATVFNNFYYFSSSTISWHLIKLLSLLISLIK